MLDREGKGYATISDLLDVVKEGSEELLEIASITEDVRRRQLRSVQAACGLTWRVCACVCVCVCVCVRGMQTIAELDKDGDGTVSTSPVVQYVPTARVL